VIKLLLLAENIHIQNKNNAKIYIESNQQIFDFAKSELIKTLIFDNNNKKVEEKTIKEKPKVQDRMYMVNKPKRKSWFSSLLLD